MGCKCGAREEIDLPDNKTQSPGNNGYKKEKIENNFAGHKKPRKVKPKSLIY